MKIELELDEHLARHLAARNGLWAGEVKEDAVTQAAEACLRRYCTFPDTVDEGHRSALAIVRAQAAEQASRGISDKHSTSISNAADRLLEFMLHGR